MLVERGRPAVAGPIPGSRHRGLATGPVRPLYAHETDTPGAIKQAPNESDRVDGEVIAAGDVRQGKEPSLVSMLTGLALIEVLRPRRSKSLSLHFVLAVTRVVAFKTLSGGDDESDGIYELWIRPGAIGARPRESVRLIDVARGGGSTAGTLVLDGVERVPVYGPNDPATDELFARLAG